MAKNTKAKSSKIKFETQIKDIRRYNSKYEETLISKDVNAIRLLRSNIDTALIKLEQAFFEYAESDNFNENTDYDKLFQSKALIEDMIVKIENEMALISEDSNKNNSKSENFKAEYSTLKLPKFDLPKFSGNLNDWLNFKELFLTSIHNNKSLSDIQKLQYLQITVSHEAAKLIKGFSISNENYIPAWETLIDRYDNKSELAFSQVSKLLNMKALKSAKSIRETLDTCNEALRNLKTLGFELNPMVELILIYVIQSKLDTSLKQQWEFSLDIKSIPELKTLMQFLEKQARSIPDSKEVAYKSENKFSHKKTAVNNVVVKTSKPCIVCNQNHLLFKCNQFVAMSIPERWNVIKLHKLCSNCLRPNHFNSNCLIDMRCKACNKKHHTLLHSFKPERPAELRKNDTSDNAVEELIPQNNVSTSAQCFSNRVSDNTQILLGTAIIKVKTKSGEFVNCRALIDSGSQSSIISTACCLKLNLPVEKSDHSITGINDVVAETQLFKTKLVFTSQFSDELYQTSALVVNKVTTNLPNFSIPFSSWKHIENLKLADPQFFISNPVDILLGADVYATIILGQPIEGPLGTPTALNSKLGWVLTGKIFDYSNQSPNLYTHHATLTLNEEIRRFWEIESIPSTSELNHESRDIDNFYQETTERDATGRYTVSLPFRGEVTLGESKGQAVRRFYYLEGKLSKNLELKSQYTQFIREYQTLGHMEQVTGETHSAISEGYYMPHHGVHREQSDTTKLRVVFDASAKSTSGVSLNDLLLSGPKLQHDLLNILLRFRTYPVALTADIEKMFRQIKIKESDANFQKIIWRENPNEELKEYKLTTVTYGTSCAPYLAIRTIQQLARDEMARFPLASEVALRDFYVDDLLSGANSVFEAKDLVSELNTLMNCGGFNLRKWASSHEEAIKELPAEIKSSAETIKIDEDKSIKVLGLNWNSKKDTLQIQISSFNPVTTKRELLSSIARIFDPLGILSPSTIILKIMMQELWKNKLSWDADIPSNIVKTWERFNSEIRFLKNIEIARYLEVSNPNVIDIQIHGFCDSSVKAYAAVLYVRVTLTSGEVLVNIIAAKSRVAPIKTITLPRLELCSALLLVQLYKAVTISIDQIKDIFFWSDSEIVLSWIKSSSKKDQFIKNRVSRIQDVTPEVKWNHVPGTENPADCATRGVFPQDLEKHPLWWTGPCWLRQGTFQVATTTDAVLYQKSVDKNVADESEEKSGEDVTPEFLFRYSSYTKSIRVVAWIRRFIHNSRNRNSPITGTLTSPELKAATHSLVKIIQQTEFKHEISALKKNKCLERQNRLLPLNVFLDQDGLLRVGGRLKHTNLSWETKHPLLLPKNHHFTQLLINHLHLKYLHGGSELVLNMIRQQFWIPSGRSQVKKVLRQCHTCFRFHARSSVPVMGNLPATRVSQYKAFQITGVDLAGPIITKPNLVRSKVRIKSYIALFVCFTTKAIHLEVVSDLSTSSFISALRRFISRRGKPAELHSDNATNFKGTKNYLKEQYDIFKSTELKQLVAEETIIWRFIPPRAPHFGGLWESNIKSMKMHLIKTCKSHILNFEELTTLLTQIEACLNSRPLTPLSSDPNDFEALTPGHFLVGSSLLSLPEPATPNSSNLLERWRVIQMIRSHFWSRWSKEYLTSLQPRSKWVVQKPDIRIGDLVVVKDISTPPLTWPLARVIRLFTGDDGVTRVVEIQTASGIFKRPVYKLLQLPVQ